MKELKKEDFEIYCFLNNLRGDNAGKIIDEIVEEVPFIKNKGYAGVDKELLVYLLDRFILDYNKEHQIFQISEDEQDKIINIAKNTLKELKPYSKSKKYLFIFPCFNKFNIEKMNGLVGFCSSKDNILIFLNTKGNNWERHLKETIYHEFAHSVSTFYKGGEFSVGEGLVFEGLAEHFREKTIGGEHAPYSIALTKEEIGKYIEELKSHLDSMDWDLYMDVFFGVGKYPNWTGYSIGYELIKQYLEEKEDIDWNKLLRKNPKEILKEAIQRYI